MDEIQEANKCEACVAGTEKCGCEACGPECAKCKECCAADCAKKCDGCGESACVCPKE